MPSMYERIRELPLFHGIGDEQLSLLLEKTSMDFIRIDSGEMIHKKGDPVTAIDFILSGQIRRIHSLQYYPVKVIEYLGPGSMLGALNLYGMDTVFSADIEATEKVSIMRVIKSQYMDILMSDRIYLLNFVNYLAANAQKGIRLVVNRKPDGILEKLDDLANALVSRKSHTVEIMANDDVLAKFCSVSTSEFKEWKSYMLDQHYISQTENGLILKSPYLIR